MKLSPGKYRAFCRLSDERRRFKIVAVDQRVPLQSLIREVANEEPTFQSMTAIKRLLTEALAPHATSILLDPEYAISCSLDAVPSETGLVVTLESAAFEETQGGRKSRVIPDWSVEKIRRIGGDGVKLLVWFNPDAAPDVVEHQLEFTRQIGRDCANHDVVFLVELLVYPVKESAEEFGRKRSDLVQRTVEAFSSAEFGIDIYKLESPVELSAVPDPEAGSDASKAVRERFTRMGSVISRPWVLLSANAEPSDFLRALKFAYQAGASGFLAGRSIWRRAATGYPELDLVKERLRTDAVPYLSYINALTDALAKQWEGELDLGGHRQTPGFPTYYRSSSQSALKDALV
jgi:tagatose 1,6-diphosphate aldolase